MTLRERIAEIVRLHGRRYIDNIPDAIVEALTDPAQREQIRSALGNFCDCPVPDGLDPRSAAPPCICEERTDAVHTLLTGDPA